MQDAIDDRQGRAAASRPSRPPGSSAPDTSDPDAAERRTFVTAEIDRMQKTVRDAVLAGVDARDCVLVLDTSLRLGPGTAPPMQTDAQQARHYPEPDSAQKVDAGARGATG